MKKLMVVVAAAVLETGCAPLLYPGRYSYPSSAHMYSAPPPAPVGRWDNVMRLPRSATIDVLTRDGAASVGAFVSATSDSVRVLISETERNIDRREVVRVDLVDLPGSDAGAVAKSAARGALLGAGVALLMGGVIGGDAWPPPGIVMRGSAAAGGLTAGEVTFVQRQGRLVYLAPTQ